LTDIRIEEQELNEARWWSHWGELRWLGRGAYYIMSADFPEPLFNHATVFGADLDAKAVMKFALEGFRKARVPPSFFVIDDPHFAVLRSKLDRAGFLPLDRMEVMTAKARRPEQGCSVEVLQVGSNTHEWAEAYVRSFYGDGGPLSQVEATVENAIKDKAVSLMLAKRRGKVVGEMALCRSGELLGAYCVGTLPEHRRSGVASGMLNHALRTAEEQGLSLVLQTFAADDLEAFYVSRGFIRVYEKLVLSKTGGSR
jgi:N-acetylglutamate synthase-like GNAT family acetyltransferase